MPRLAPLILEAEPTKAKRPSRRKQLSHRLATDSEQSEMVKQYMAIYNEPEGEPSTSTADLEAPGSSSPASTAEASGWRSIEDVPSHIPPFLPPLPGLERPFMALPPQPTALAPTPANVEPAQPAAESTAQANTKEEAPRATNAGALNMALSAAADLATHQYKHGHVDPWKHVVPFERSHLLLREPQLLPTNVPLPLKNSDVAPEDHAKAHSSLMAYFQLHKRLAAEPPLQPTWSSRSKRRQAAALLQRPDAAISDRFDLSDINTSIGGLVGAQRPRFVRKTAGWLPYPLHRPKDSRDRKGQQPNPLLHAYDLQSDILDNISEPLTGSAQHDLTTELSALVGGSNARRAAGRDAGLPPGVKGFMRRVTRIAQPGPLGSSGETLPYVIQDGDITAGDHSKRLLYGFDWKEQDFARPLQQDSTNSIQETETGPQAGPSGTQGGQDAGLPVQTDGQAQTASGPTPSEMQNQQHQTNGARAEAEATPKTTAVKLKLNGGNHPAAVVVQGEVQPLSLLNGSATSSPSKDQSSAMDLDPASHVGEANGTASRQSAPPTAQHEDDSAPYDWVNGSQIPERSSAPPASMGNGADSVSLEPLSGGATSHTGVESQPAASEDVEMLPVIGSKDALAAPPASTEQPALTEQPTVQQDTQLQDAPPVAPAEQARQSESPKRLSIKIGPKPSAVADTPLPHPTDDLNKHVTSDNPSTNPEQSPPVQQSDSPSVAPAVAQQTVATPEVSQSPAPTPEVKQPLKLSFKLGGGPPKS